MEMNNQIPHVSQSSTNPQQIILPAQINQVIRPEIPPNFCEKFSACLTGTRNIPLTVFLILMGVGLNVVISLFLVSCFPLGFFMYLWSSIGLTFFGVFVWAPTAIKIEKSSSTVRYGLLYLINHIILCGITFRVPLFPTSLWSFILFETLLISMANKNKKMKFFCCKVTGKVMIVLVILYNFIFNCYFFFSLVATIIYALIYKKYLMSKFAFSNERIATIENFCIVNFFKNKLETFITLHESLVRGQNNLRASDKQPVIAPTVNQSVNSSFVPLYFNQVNYSGNQSSLVSQPMLAQNIQSNINIAGELSENSSYFPNPNSSSYENHPQ